MRNQAIWIEDWTAFAEIGDFEKDYRHRNLPPDNWIRIVNETAAPQLAFKPFSYTPPICHRPHMPNRSPGG